MRGATKRIAEPIHNSSISTHAPLAGRDCLRLLSGLCTMHFNPRAPCGARLVNCRNSDVVIVISTHAPLAGRDYDTEQVISKIPSFQPTRPLRGATIRRTTAPKTIRISTHAPLAGRDSRCCYLVYWQRSISTHAPLASRSIIRRISTHAPLAGRDHGAWS